MVVSNRALLACLALGWPMLSALAQTEFDVKPEDHMPTCQKQANCIRFTKDQVNSETLCYQGECVYQVCLVLDYYSPGCAKKGSIQYMCDRADGVGCPHPPGANGLASFDDFDEQHAFDPLSILPGDDSIFGVPPTCDEFNPTYKVACQDALNGYRMCHYGRAKDHR